MIASLSIDLDNKWAYLRTASRPDWKSYPSYLADVIPRMIGHLASADMRATIFVVARDLLAGDDAGAIRSLAHAGHPLGNHTLEHNTQLHSLPPDLLHREIVEAHRMILEATGQTCIGFRGPGFSDSSEVHAILQSLGYRYCASSFPSSVGPLARTYYLLRAGLRKETTDRKMFGAWNNVLQRNRPYPMAGQGKGMWMVPVTVQPMSRLPMHFTYFFFLCQKSTGLARTYLRWSLSLCRLWRVAPSLLLHPLDFLGGDEHPDLQFFPGMGLRKAYKLEQMDWALQFLSKRWDVLPIEEQVARLEAGLRSRQKNQSLESVR